MAKEVFNRYELKYVITATTYTELLKRLGPYLSVDTYGNAEGYYTVSSIYYDTVNNLFHRERILGQSFRQKLRMRVYNKASLEDYAFIEIKKKHKKVVNKRRTLMRLKDAYEFLDTKETLRNITDFEASNQQILKEIDFFKNFYELVPKVVVSYERQAFQTKDDGSIRVTFDKNVRKRNQNFRLENGSNGELYLAPNLYVMEIKLSERMPLWLTRILSEYRCVIQPFSKYSNSFQETEGILEEENII